MANAEFDQVRTKNLQIVDEDGNLRVGIIPGAIALFDNKGQMRAQLFIIPDNDDVGLVLHDAAGMRRIFAGIDNTSGMAQLTFFQGNSGQYAAMLVSDGKGGSQLFLADADGQIVWEAK